MVAYIRTHILSNNTLNTNREEPKKLCSVCASEVSEGGLCQTAPLRKAQKLFLYFVLRSQNFS